MATNYTHDLGCGTIPVCMLDCIVQLTARPDYKSAELQHKQAQNQHFFRMRMQKLRITGEVWRARESSFKPGW
jgi:hypothetical protein